MNKKMNERKNIKFGALIAYITLFLNICINIFYTPILLNSVGDRNYGLWSFVLSITSWFSTAVYAIYDSYVRFSTVEKKEKGCEDRTNSIYLRLLVILAVIISMVAIFILFFLYNGVIPLKKYNQNEKNTIFVLFIISTIQVLATTILSLFKLFNEYKNNFIFVKSIALLQVIFITGGSLIALAIHSSIVIVALINVSLNIVALICYFISAKVYLKMKFSMDTLKENRMLVASIFSFSAFLLITTIVSEINNAVDKTLLGFFAGAEMVTIYQLGMSFNVYFSELSASVNSVFIPQINKLAVNGDDKGINQLFLKISKFQTIIVSFIAGGFAICGRDFVLAWVGNKRIGAYWVGLVLLILFSVDYGSYSSLSIQRAYNKHRIPAFINLGVTIANVIISVVLLIVLPEEMSIIACLGGTAFSAVVGKWIIIPIYNKRKIGLPVGKFYVTFAWFMLISFVSCIFTQLLVRFLGIDGVMHGWFIFLLKGLVYSSIYLVIVIPLNFNFIKMIFKR